MSTANESTGTQIGDAGSARKLRHDARRARQRAKRGTVLPPKRGRTVDLTPHIATANMATKGKYLELGRGFFVRWQSMKKESKYAGKQG